VLEQQTAQRWTTPPEDGREIALTHRARRVMQALGLWQALPESGIAPLREARVVDGDAPQPCTSDARGRCPGLAGAQPPDPARGLAGRRCNARPCSCCATRA
jgi:2-polyprenyl-6-methoxyphenol hydroxylase-like FAD-dependent oxidoreductase